jgi:PhoPQ-activated pathogenicity-related protein
MVPNQPLVFFGEIQGRKEDAFIAYTWDRYLRSGDGKWPARLPMTKSVVRAMDAITQFCGGSEGGQIKVDSFVVTGASKRAWTTWSVAAVDNRVIAIIPLVIDLLNIEQSLLHHYAAYGFWSPAIKDYTAIGIMDWTGTPEFNSLMRIEDPFHYRQRLTMPKFIINAADDQFFLPDSSQFYFDALVGPKYLRYVPNADHSLRESDAFQTLAVSYASVVNGYKLPEYSWKLEKDSGIRVMTKSTPSEVRIWQATNPDARDFRMDTFGPRWQSSLISAQPDGTYLAKVTTPEKGWTGFFVELTFPVHKDVPALKLTTQVRVVPDRLPFKFVPKPPVMTRSSAAN